MATIFNIRGTNGSGKTTLARAFLPRSDREGGPVDLSEYDSPTKRDPGRKLRYPGYANEPLKTLVLGSYSNACGGMDSHPAGKGFIEPRKAILYALNHPNPNWAASIENIICEGVLASGVYGSWHEFACELEPTGNHLAFVYLHTTAEECLRRIQERRVKSGMPPKTGPDWDRMVRNVTDKHGGTMETRKKAIRDGHLVFDLPVGVEHTAFGALVRRDSQAWEVYRARA